MKYIGIKLADGSFYPVLEEGKPTDKLLDLTTVQDNQTTVQIDLYRSELGSMEDAEYVDTLEIKNLQPHPNGEPNLNLKVTLDENNELNAEVTDPETGKSSETQVSLVSRTLAERNAKPVNFALDNNTVPVIEEDLTQPDPIEENTVTEDIPLQDIDVPVDNIDINIPDTEPENSDTLTNSEIADIEKKSEQELNKDTIIADTVEEDNEVIDPSLNNEDFSFDDLTVDSDKEKNNTADEIDITNFNNAVQSDTLSTTKTTTDNNENFENLDTNLPDFSDLDNNFGDESNSETEISNKDSTSETDNIFKESDYSVPDFDQPKELPNNLTNFFDNSDTDSSNTDNDTSSSTDDDTSSNTDDNSSSNTSPIDSTIEQKTEFIDSSIAEEEVADEPISDTFDTDISLQSNSEPSDDFISDSELNIEGMDIDETKEKTSSDSIISSDPTYNPSNEIDFNNLYDDETKNGESNIQQETDIKKKTKVPVIICIICAIICIIATLLVLFVIPSKLNILKSKNSSSEETVTEQETFIEESIPEEQEFTEEIPQEPEEVPAVEDEIVVAPTPEVVPVPPPPAEEIPEDIKYKIKWGDTLWDISDAYYKNPWRYKKLAKYNHIKNPDVIISGTYILIPAE